MSPLVTTTVAVRRVLAKRPWIYWLFVSVVALAVAASILDRADRVDAERAAWGETVTVFVADRALAPGDPLSVDAHEVPAGMVPTGRIASPDGLVARQHVGEGEIVTDVDVVASGGPQAMTPDGWLGVPIVESPNSGARLGDRVQVVSDGVVISGEAIVVGHHDDVTVVAVPAEVAPAVPAAADARSLSLLLIP